MKHIIFIVGSLRKDSFNRQLAKITEEMLKDRFKISYLDFENIPFMNQDLESSIVKRLRTTDYSHFLRITDNGELEADIYKLSEFYLDLYHRNSIENINRIRQQIKRCDGIWIFTPEYNHSYPGLLKNLFDWLSRPEDITNFTIPTVIQGKKVTVSGAGGKNKTTSCREKLNELLEYVKMDVMKEPQAGIELGMEAWVKGEFHLTEGQIRQLEEQANRFAEFVSVS